MIDINAVRRNTEGVQYVAHFNNAGSSLLPKPVAYAMTDYLHDEIRYGGYETMEKYQDDISLIYKHLAQMLNAQPSEIALLQSASLAWLKVFFSIPFRKGDKVLVSRADYITNYLSYLQVQERHEIEIEIIPDDSFGQTSPEALAKMIDSKVKLISITHIPSAGGLVNPVEEIGKIAKENGILYMLDACQAVGQMPLDVQKIGCDVLTATGRKYMRAPRGTGFLYLNQRLLDEKLLSPIFLDGRSASWTDEKTYTLQPNAQVFENFENHWGGLLGLGKATEYALQLGLENIWERIQMLSKNLRQQLSEIQGVNVRDRGEKLCGIVTFEMANKSPELILQALKAKNINVSLAKKQSTLLDMKNRNLESLVRASVHYFNTEEEIAELVGVIRKQ